MNYDMTKQIKLFDPVISNEEKSMVNKVFQSGFWASGAGTGYVRVFEEKFCKYVGSKECIAVNSGTAALHLALSILDIKNKEVLLPSLSFVSTAHAVIYNGGKPVFVDVDPITLCLDPVDVNKKITKKTSAILPVHFAGMPANLTQLAHIKNEHSLMLIEDAAHSCGASFQNKKIGSHGDMICFSFHPVKNLAMPSGGLISINRSSFKDLKKTLSTRRWCGITDRKDSFYNVKEIGWNFYMNEFSAAIGLVQLSKLDKLNTKRKRIAQRYYDEINLDQKMPFDENCVYHFYWILLKNRSTFRKEMKKAGIETGIHYQPIHKFTMYANHHSLPITENVGNSLVSLPTHPNLSDSDVDFIIDSVNKFAKA